MRFVPPTAPVGLPVRDLCPLPGSCSVLHPIKSTALKMSSLATMTSSTQKFILVWGKGMGKYIIHK